MATTSISWFAPTKHLRALGADRGVDIHLLPETQTRPDSGWLTERLLFCQELGPPIEAPDVPDDIASSLEFVPNFKWTRVAEEFVGPGVKVHAKNGQITTAKTPPAGPRLRNFLIRPKAGSLVGDPIRVHLHGAIEDIWLTPNPMTVRDGASARFTVLARFDDGVIGDITMWEKEIRLLPGISDLRFTWRVSPPRFEVFSGTISSYTPDPAAVPVTLELPAALGRKTATADVRGAAPWRQETRAILVDGSDLKIDFRKNFLFLADGFKEGERAAFHHTVARIVRSLRHEPFTQPYGDLADSMNYWAVFTPSPDAGCSQQHEFRLVGNSGRGEIVERVRRPKGAAARDVAELFHEIGTPVPVDDIPGLPLAEKIDVWNALYQSPKITGLTEALYRRWKSYARRALVNESDTALSLQLGHRPSASTFIRELTRQDSRRVGDRLFANSYLKQLLSSVYCMIKPLEGPPQKVVIGPRWASGPDVGLVAIVARTNTFGGENNRPGYVAVRTTGYAGGMDEPLKAASGKRGLNIDARPLRRRELARAVVTTCAHEWAHSLGLLDEYGEDQCENKYGTAVIDEAPNLQRIEQLLGPDQKKLVGEKIKWLWPRIRKAAVLTREPHVSGPTVTLEVRWPQGKDFADKDEVFLRRRRLTPDGSLQGAPFVSGRLEVSEASSAPDKLVLTAVDPFTEADARNFAAGSIVFLPARAKAGTPEAGQMLTLVAPAIVSHISATGGPLNADSEHEDPARACIPDPDKAYVRMQPLNLPDPMPPTRVALADKAEIVGLYEGGGFHGCEVYHPAGVCTFRGQEHKGEPTRGFCRVCRYVIVDAVDPSKHRLSDDAYDDFYPGPEHA